jgi:hypothetical protein
VSVHWSLESPKLCPAVQRKINSHLTADRRPVGSTSLGDVGAHEMRRSVIGWSFVSANLQRPDERPKPSHWKERTNDVFRVSASGGADSAFIDNANACPAYRSRATCQLGVAWPPNDAAAPLILCKACGGRFCPAVRSAPPASKIRLISATAPGWENETARRA